MMPIGRESDRIRPGLHGTRLARRPDETSILQQAVIMSDIGRLDRAAIRATAMALAFAVCTVCASTPADRNAVVPSFHATALTGTSVSRADLLGEPTVLIVTPSREAADDTRQWAESLRQRVDQRRVHVRACWRSTSRSS
jgi:hypothetical protein